MVSRIYFDNIMAEIISFSHCNYMSFMLSILRITMKSYGLCSDIYCTALYVTLLVFIICMYLFSSMLMFHVTMCPSAPYPASATLCTISNRFRNIINYNHLLHNIHGTVCTMLHTVYMCVILIRISDDGY